MGSIPTRSRRTGDSTHRNGRGYLLDSRYRAFVGKALTFAFVVGAGAPPSLAAQETDPPAPSAATVQDSLALQSDGDLPAVEDSVGVGNVEDETGAPAAAPLPPLRAAPADSAGPLPPVSPMGAFFRSLVLPGWGQVSVDQPGRGAFYFAMEAGSLWMLFKTNAKLNAAKSSNPRNDDLIAAREAQFEDWATLAVFWALFSGVDAWVSAQLWDFKGEVVPPPDGSPGAAFQYSVPVGP